MAQRTILSGGGPTQDDARKTAYLLGNSTAAAARFNIHTVAGLNYCRLTNAVFQTTGAIELCSSDVTNRDLSRFQAFGAQRLRVENALPSGATNMDMLSSGTYSLRSTQNTDAGHYLPTLFENGNNHGGSTLLTVGVDYSHLVEVSPAGVVSWFIDGALELEFSGGAPMADEEILLWMEDNLSDDQEHWVNGFFRCEYDDPFNQTAGRPQSTLTATAIFPTADVDSTVYHNANLNDPAGHGLASHTEVDDWLTGPAFSNAASAITGEPARELWDWSSGVHPEIETLYTRIRGHANVEDKITSLDILTTDQDDPPNEQTHNASPWLDINDSTRGVNLPTVPDGAPWQAALDPQDELDKLRLGLEHPAGNGAHIVIVAILGESLSLKSAFPVVAEGRRSATLPNHSGRPSTPPSRRARRRRPTAATRPTAPRRASR